MPYTNIKWFIRARQTLKPDTFTKFLTCVCDTFPEAQAKLLANGFIGDLGTAGSIIKLITGSLVDLWIQLKPFGLLD